METKSKKLLISTVAISLFMLSMFLMPITLASGSPYITVGPSPAVPGSAYGEIVNGYNFPAGATVNIYMDAVDGYHLLGSVVTRPDGSFTFSFVMQSNYPGSHTIIAVGEYAPYPHYTASFTLRYTNPLDQRLIDLVSSATSTLENDITNAKKALENDITSAQNTLAGDISTATSILAGDIASATSILAGDINSAQSNLESWMTSNIQNHALVVQASVEPQRSGTTDSVWLNIQVNYARDGTAVTLLSPLYSNFHVTVISYADSNPWSVAQDGQGNLYVNPMGYGTYAFLLTPSSDTSSLQFVTVRVEVSFVSSGITYSGSTLATITCLP
jgi:hypothetical protein